jgi:predicted nucleic-acid-binding Zn-ribbon protein
MDKDIDNAKGIENSDYPKCAKCGSHNIGTKMVQRIGIPTFFWVLQMLFPKYITGCGLPMLNEMHPGMYCKNCGSEKILQSPPGGHEDYKDWAYYAVRIVFWGVIIGFLAFWWFFIMN